jgi:transcriptional regulator with PAS, ATPase and Fis domain
LEELLRAGPVLHALMGVTSSNMTALEWDERDSRFYAEIIWMDSAEAEEHMEVFGMSDYPVCWILCGYASGYASFCLGVNIYFSEKKCRAAGSPECMAVGMDRKSWGSGLKEFQSYFEAEDIKERVMKLTEELRKKNRMLERNRERLHSLERASRDAFIEVNSRSFQKTLDIAARVARFDSPVLITGETGTGKEVLARYIHRNSVRSGGKFIAVNCASLPETLLESELFGHKVGAFTGAVSDRIGLFEEANNGTLFLDEIGDISPAMQNRLLRVLQEKEVIRLGENIPRKVNARIIAATNRKLADDVAGGRFREDLYYRIRIIEIEVPPLRDRADDILPLARFFIRKLSKKFMIRRLNLDATCVDLLLHYKWPGNVRELENVLERAAILASGGIILPEHLPFSITHPGETLKTGVSDPLSITLAELERDHIDRVLELCGGSRTKAARALGISLTTLWRKTGGGKDN